MAWQVFKQVKSGADLVELDVDQQQDDPDKEVAEQISVAVKVATEIIDSGALGAGESYHVFLSGNANVGHQADSMHPQAQHDTISVAVTTAAYPGHAKAAAKAEHDRKKAEIEARAQAELDKLDEQA